MTAPAFSSFATRETLAVSIARCDAADCAFFQARARDMAALAAFALSHRAFMQAITLQRAAAFYAGEARRCLFKLLEG
jgi:hypothetical protein